MSDTLFPTPTFPEPALLSIYNLHPRKENRAQSLKRIREALTRICEGELDCQPRTEQQAIEYLRSATTKYREESAGKEKRWIAHSTTWFHQSRYLRTVVEEVPKDLLDCIEILCEYPTAPKREILMRDPVPWMPTLRAISKAIDNDHLSSMMDVLPRDWLKNCVIMYAVCVAQWPEEDLRFVPSPINWFTRRNYEQNPAVWQRKSANNYESGRQQIARVLNS